MTGEMRRRTLRREVAGFFFLSGILTATWNSRIPDVQDHLELGNAAWGVVLAALPLGLFLALPFASWLVARFGTGKVVLVNSVIACIGLALLGAASERLSLMLVLFFIGVNRTIMNIAVNTSAVEVQQLYQKPVISVFHGLWSVACFAAAQIGALMIIWKIIPSFHFLFVAILGLAGLFFSSRSGVQVNHSIGRKPFFVKPDRYLLLLGITAFFSMSAENTMFDWSINYFDKVLDIQRKWMTVGYTCFIVMMSLGRLAGDRLIHRFGYFNMLVFNGMLMACGFAIASMFPSFWAASFGFLLVGLGDATIVPIVYSLAGRSQLPPAYAIASVTTIGYIGFLVNPLVVGFISASWGMQWAFALMALFSICVAALGSRIASFQPAHKSGREEDTTAP